MKEIKKGQYFSFDVLIAGVIAIIAFSALLLYWQYSIEQDPSNIEIIRRELIKHMTILTGENENYSILIKGSHVLKNGDDINKSINKYINDFTVQGLLCVKVGNKLYGNTTIDNNGNEKCNVGQRQAKIERLFIANDTDNVILVEFYFSRQ